MLFAFVSAIVAVWWYLIIDQYSVSNEGFGYSRGYHEETSTATGKIFTDTYVKTTNIMIPVGGRTRSRIHAWLYMPNAEKVSKNREDEGAEASIVTEVEGQQPTYPIVLMSHGLGAQKDMGLERYAEQFAADGFAVLAFDYRYFGGSQDNEPTLVRNLISGHNHGEDIATVVQYVKEGFLGPLVDPSRLALWGTSMAGGHVLKVAHDLGPGNISCVISQIPHLDGKAASKRGIQQRGFLGTVKVFVLAVTDFVWSELLGLSPVYVKIVGRPTDVAYMMLEDSEIEAYFSKHPTTYLGGWKNLAPARTLAVLSLYNPISFVAGISKEIPILFVGGTRDSLCPIEYIRDATKLAANARLLEIDTTHFNMYGGDAFVTAVDAMKAFLREHLL